MYRPKDNDDDDEIEIIVEVEDSDDEPPPPKHIPPRTRATPTKPPPAPAPVPDLPRPLSQRPANLRTVAAEVRRKREEEKRRRETLELNGTPPQPESPATKRPRATADATAAAGPSTSGHPPPHPAAPSQAASSAHPSHSSHASYPRAPPVSAAAKMNSMAGNTFRMSVPGTTSGGGGGWRAPYVPPLKKKGPDLASLLEREKQESQRLQKEQSRIEMNGRLPPAVQQAYAERQRQQQRAAGPATSCYYDDYEYLEKEDLLARTAQKGFQSFAEKWRAKNASAPPHHPSDSSPPAQSTRSHDPARPSTTTDPAGPPPRPPPPTAPPPRPPLPPRPPAPVPLRGPEDPFLAAQPPDNFESCSVAELKAFLQQAKIPLRAATEKSDLLQLAKSSVSAWEISRILQCSKSEVDATRRALYVLRLDPTAARDGKAAKKAFLKLSLLVHPDKALGRDVKAEHAKEAFLVLQEALDKIQNAAAAN